MTRPRRKTRFNHVFSDVLLTFSCDDRSHMMLVPRTPCLFYSPAAPLFVRRMIDTGVSLV
ncbi:protein of unknown function [Methylocella tundrae]|uniref:Uncharacterized protein n=1 Tax=Methylocella tundrae TaxID=227605 RepID=A0A4V6IMK8_METTU|nr:protein of unknown function [Methylocella tundrae]